MNQFGFAPQFNQQSYGQNNQQSYGQNNSWDNFTAKLSAHGRTFDEIKNASDRKAIITSLGIHDAIEIAAIETEWSNHMNQQSQDYNTTASEPPAFSQFQQHNNQQAAGWSNNNNNNNNNNHQVASLQARLAQRQSGGAGGGCCSIQ